MHLLPAVAIQSVNFSVKSLFMPDSYGAFIKASLEMHAQITSPSERFHIARCSMALQKQQIKNESFHLSFGCKIKQTSARGNLFVLDLDNFNFYQSITHLIHVRDCSKKVKSKLICITELKSAEKRRKHEKEHGFSEAYRAN